MRNLLSSLFLLFVLISNAQVNLSLNLMAYYPFKGNANDVSGKDNNGVLSGPILTTDKNNASNKAYKYNNLPDKISVPYNTSLDISGTKNFSAAVWFNPSMVNSLDGRLLNFGSIYGKSYELIYTSPTSGVDSGRIQFVNFSTGANPQFVINLFSSTKVVLNTWSLVIITVDGITGATRMYLNDVLVGSSSIMPVIPTSSSTSTYPIITIGNHPAFDWGFKGSLDEIRLYNRILNPSEITYLYSNYSAIKKVGTNINIDIYPNPLSNKLNIQSPMGSTCSIEIFDLAGHIVLTDSFITKKELDLHSLEAGTYIIKIITKNGTVVKKVEKI